MPVVPIDMVSFNTLTALRVFLSACSGVAVFIFYFTIIRSVMRKESSPNCVSWLIWSINDTLVVFASWNAGARNTIPVPLIYSVCGWFIVVAALRNKFRLPTKIEIGCLLGAVLGWVSFLYGMGPFHSLVIAVAVNTIGAVPTVSSLIKNAYAERFGAWIFVWIGSVLSLLSLETFRSELIIFPVDSVFISTTVISLILRRRTPSIVFPRSKAE